MSILTISYRKFGTLAYDITPRDGIDKNTLTSLAVIQALKTQGYLNPEYYVPSPVSQEYKIQVDPSDAAAVAAAKEKKDRVIKRREDEHKAAVAVHEAVTFISENGLSEALKKYGSRGIVALRYNLGWDELEVEELTTEALDI